MNKLKSFSKETLLRPAIPLTACVLSYLAEYAIGGPIPFHLPSSKDISFLNMFLYTTDSHDQVSQLEDLNPFEKVRNISLGAYKSYFQFMITMFFLNIVLEVLYLGFKLIHYKMSSSKAEREFSYRTNSFSLDQTTLFCELKKVGSTFLKRIFYYSVSYCILRILLICASCLIVNFVLNIPHKNSPLFLSHQTEGKLIDIYQDSQINLGDHEPIFQNERMLVSQKPTLADVMDSTDIAATAMVLSTDEKYAYLVHETSDLEIIDTSNINSLTHRISFGLNYSRFKGITISNDGKTLFIGDPSFIQIVNVTDPFAPVIIGEYEHKHEEILIPWNSKVTLTLSNDGNTLFISHWGLLILDVSNLKTPVALFRIDELLTTHVLSKDSQFLYLTDGSIYYGDYGGLAYRQENTFRIYNVANPKNPVLVSQLTPKGGASSVVLSSDERTAYLLSIYDTTEEGKDDSLQTYLQTIDISDKASPKPLKILDLEESGNSIYSLVGLYNSDSFLFIADATDLKIVDLKGFESLKRIPETIQTAFTIIPSFDTRFGYVITKTQFLRIQFHLDMKNSAIFSPREYILSSLQLGKNLQDMSLTPDGKTLIIAATKDDKSFIEIIDVTNSNAPSLVKTFEIGNEHPEFISLNPNGKLLNIFNTASINVYDITNLKNPFKTVTIEKELSRYMEISPDLKILYSVERDDDGIQFKVLDITSPSKPELLGTVSLPMESFFYTGMISRDGKTAYILSNLLSIIDVSDLKAPSVIGSITIKKHDFSFVKPKMALTKDEKILYVVSTEEKYHVLKAINLSDKRNPFIMSKTNLPNKQNGDKFHLSRDDKTIYFEAQGGGYLVINVMNPTAPIILTLICSNSAPFSSISKISVDNSVIYMGDEEGIKIVSIKPKFSLYTTDETFKLGGRFTNTLSILKLNKGGTYLPIDQSYKFTKLSLYEIKVFPSQFTPTQTTRSIPTWMHFDKENALLDIEPKIQAHIGSYNLFCVISTFIPEEAFKGIDTIETPSDSYDLLLTLITLGYVDNEGFLTSSFDPTQTLMLPPKYKDKDIESKIRSRLEKHYLETITRIQVAPSLVLLQNKFLSVETLSAHSLNVAITLKNDPTKEPEIQFVDKVYSFVLTTISEKRTRMIMEGNHHDINNALKELVVNIEEEGQTTEALITISDGLNPTLNVNIPDALKYFVKNEYPIVDPKYDVQSQIDGFAVYTGEPFTIELSQKTFRDLHDLELEYKIAMQDEKEHVPGWISMKDLKIIGTPPQEWSKPSYEFAIIVENEFKSIQVNFTLSVRISLQFALKVLATYGGYLFTLIGLWIYANKIYNIFAKKHYRHPKKFIIKVEEEITDKTIFPIAFIGIELQESALVFREIERLISKGLNSNILTSSQLVGHFVDSVTGHLDKGKIISLVEQIIPKLFSRNNPSESRSKKYIFEIDSHKNLIQQIIINKIVKKQLESHKEKCTKTVFETIKGDWLDLVDGEASQFIVNKAKLINKLKKIGIELDEEIEPQKEEFSIDDLIDQPREKLFTIDRFDNIHFKNDENVSDGILLTSPKTNESSSSSRKPRSMEKSLMGNEKQNKLNVDLLENAICAHAFEYQHLDIEAIQIHIEAKQKARGSSAFHRIKRFLKLDLRPIAFMDKGKIGYGILYQIENDILHFYGVPHANVRGKTLVVQITNGKGKILRELWLYGFNNDENQGLKEGEAL